MKRKYALVLLLVLITIGVAWAAVPRFYNVFFICQLKSANIGGVDYDYYEITSGGQTYYAMEYGWHHPPGISVQRVIRIAKSGSNYLLYFHTNNSTKADIAGSADQYAGGGSSVFRSVALAQAHLTYVLLSVNQKGAHSSFPAQAAIKLTIPCRWTGSGGWKTYGDWLTAGGPVDDFRCGPVLAGAE